MIDVPRDSRSVRPGGSLFDLSRQLHRTWVPLCAWEGKMNDGMHSVGGWRIVTTARAHSDVLGGRSCEELHVHRPAHQGCPLAASIENMCRRITPKLLHTITTQEVTQFIAGATVPKRQVGKQTIPPEESASVPSSSSAGPELPGEPPEPGDQPRMSLDKIPLAEVGPEIET